MVAKADDGAARADRPKLALAALVVVASLAGYYLMSEVATLWRVIGLLAGLGAAIAIAYTSHAGRSLVGFFEDARTEVRKVVWPTGQETMQTTLIVAVIVILVGLFLWLLDWGFGVAFRAVTGVGG